MESFNNCSFRDPDVVLLLDAGKTPCTQFHSFVSTFELVCTRCEALNGVVQRFVDYQPLVHLDHSVKSHGKVGYEYRAAKNDFVISNTFLLT